MFDWPLGKKRSLDEITTRNKGLLKIKYDELNTKKIQWDFISHCLFYK